MSKSNTKKTVTYTIVIEPDEDTYMVWVPALRGAISCADALREVKENAREVIGMMCDELHSQGIALPSDRAAPMRVLRKRGVRTCRVRAELGRSIPVARDKQ